MRSFCNKLRIFAIIPGLLASVTLPAATNLSAAEWQIEMVDQSGPGKFSSMRIDKDGNAHLAYVAEDGTNNQLKYGFWDHALKRWFIMPIANGASFCSLALDSKQRPHISYADYGTMSGARLHHAYWDGTIWTNTTLPINSETVAYYTSIVLDASDNPSISFYEYDGPRGSGLRVRMRVVTWTGKYWGVVTVDGQNQSGKFNDLAIDAKGHMHLAYANVNGITAGMRYAFFDGNDWRTEVLEELGRNNSAYVGYSAAIAVDQQGNPHITYSTYSAPYSVNYAVRKNGRWQIQRIEALGGVGYPDRNSITLDESGTPYVAYYDSAGRGLRVAHIEGGRWVAETVEGSVGYTSSVRIDRGTLWVSYADEVNGGIKVARRKLKDTPPVQAASAPGR